MSKGSGMIRTRLLVHVGAARRSGQHAVIWWLRSLMHGPHLRFNNCKVPYTPRKPDRAAIQEMGDEPLNGLFINYEDKELACSEAGTKRRSTPSRSGWQPF